MVIYLENITSIKKLLKSMHILSRIVRYRVNIKNHISIYDQQTKKKNNSNYDRLKIIKQE